MPPSPSFRRGLAAVLLCLSAAAAVLVPTVAQAGPAPVASVAATVAEEEYSFLQKLNTERVRAGLKALVSDSKLAPTSRSWSGTMASRGSLVHDPNLAAVASQVEPDWRAVGENIGYGYSVQQLHDLFLASAGHRANVLKASYNRVGIGVVHSGGKIWVTVRFLEGPAISGPTGLGPPPPPPGIRASLTGDFDGDGHGDLLTYGPGTATDELWFGTDDRSLRKASVEVNGHYRPLVGDFGGDGRDDILWYAPGSYADYVWSWNGTGWTSKNVTVNGTYAPVAGDFDGDGRDDILWYAPGSRADSYWYGNGNGTFTSVATTINGTYRPVTGNLDGRYGDDIFWYAPGSAKDFIWYSVAARGRYTDVRTTVNGTYKPFAGDFDGSGTTDIFWYAPGSGNDFVWYTTSTRGQYRSVSRKVTGSYLPGTADFDDDRADDIIWYAPSSAAGDPLWWGTSGSSTVTTSTLRTS